MDGWMEGLDSKYGVSAYQTQGIKTINGSVPFEVRVSSPVFRGFSGVLSRTIYCLVERILRSYCYEYDFNFTENVS